MRKSFTLMEVMVSVVIIFVVIGSIQQIASKSGLLFPRFHKQIESIWISSLFLGDEKYGFEDDSLFLDELLEGFEVEDDFRQQLKKIKTDITYTELLRFNSSELEESSEDEIIEDNAQDISLEIGRTSYKYDIKTPSSYLHLKIE